jgi:Domain of unknown function (DUF4411)
MQPSFVFDTSAFINSWNHHYRLPVFQGVWDALGYAMAKGQVVAPSEVLVDIEVRAGDALHTWLKVFDNAFVPPEASWAAHIETLRGHAPHWFAGTGRHEADPFVVAMAMEARLPVVTYEGQAFSGDPARIRTQRRSMPHICALVDVPVATMFDVLSYLGVVLS